MPPVVPITPQVDAAANALAVDQVSLETLFSGIGPKTAVALRTIAAQDGDSALVAAVDLVLARKEA